MRRSLILALAFASLLFTPSAAGAPPFRPIYDEYLHTHSVDGCAHGEGELQAALTSIPADVEAYDPGFADALNTALENRTAGCEPRLPSVGGAVRTAADGSPGPPVFSPPPSPAPAPSGPSALPLQLLVFGVFAAVALMVFLLPRRGRRSA